MVGIFIESFTNSTTCLPISSSFGMLKIKQCNFKKESRYPSFLANTVCVVELGEIILRDINVSEGK